MELTENRPIDMACEILEKTNDGDDLAPHHLKLLEIAVNGWLSEQGKVSFYELYAQVKKGYRKPWFHGVKNLTIDHVGYVYWKGKEVEHYTPRWSYSDKAHESAIELGKLCEQIESEGLEVNGREVMSRF